MVQQRRRGLALEDRAQIGIGIEQGLSDREIGELVGRDRSVVWRERRRNSWKTTGYKPVAADIKERRRRALPQTRAIDADPVLAARVRADLKRSRTPHQIAGRLRVEASDSGVVVKHSRQAQGRTVSHEAIYRPAHLRGSLTWDEGTEMARHAALTMATDLPLCFAHPHSRWERPSNENTNGLIREYLPKGIEITSHQPYLTAIADELDDRPRQRLGFHTPRVVFERLLIAGDVA